MGNKIHSAFDNPLFNAWRDYHQSPVAVYRELERLHRIKEGYYHGQGIQNFDKVMASLSRNDWEIITAITKYYKLPALAIQYTDRVFKVLFQRDRDDEFEAEKNFFIPLFGKRFVNARIKESLGRTYNKETIISPNELFRDAFLNEKEILVLCQRPLLNGLYKYWEYILIGDDLFEFIKFEAGKQQLSYKLSELKVM